MPKVTDQHRASRRDQIIDAALICFAERGFKAASMADIIAAAGLSAGAIYLYFDSKRAIIIAAAERAIAGVANDLIAPQPGALAPPPSALIHAIGQRLDANAVSPRLLVQLWGEAATDEAFNDLTTTAFRTLLTSLRTYLARWADQAGIVPGAPATSDQDHSTPRPAALDWAEDRLPVMLALCQGFIIQRALLPHFDEAAYLAAVAHLLG